MTKMISINGGDNSITVSESSMENFISARAMWKGYGNFIKRNKLDNTYENFNSYVIETNKEIIDTIVSEGDYIGVCLEKFETGEIIETTCDVEWIDEMNLRIGNTYMEIEEVSENNMHYECIINGKYKLGIM